MKQKNGFTMMEILVVILIVAILAAIGIPSYLNYVTKGRRNDAIHSLLGIQLEQEKWRLNNNTYGTLNDVWGGVTATEGGFYTLAVTSNTATAYTLTATTTGSQVGDSEDGTSCNVLTLTNNNGAVTKTPAVCWNEG